MLRSLLHAHHRPELWLLAALALLSALLPEGVALQFEYQREAIAQGELWRLLTGHLVHFGGRHALADGLGLLILAWAVRDLAWRWGPLPLLLLISAALWLVAPELQSYRGASALVMLVLALWLRRLWQQQPTWRVGLGLFMVVLALKLVADALGLAAAWSTLPAGISVAWQAHLLGFALGWLAAGSPCPTRDNAATTEAE